MTVENTPCPAAVIGRRIAELDEKLNAMDRRSTQATRTHQEQEARVTEDALTHLADELENVKLSLTHVKATSPDGAAAQVAYAISLVQHMDDFEPDERAEHRRCTRAIERLLYSAISHLQDRVEADCVSGGVEALASCRFDPWQSVKARLSAYRELGEEKREHGETPLAAE